MQTVPFEEEVLAVLLALVVGYDFGVLSQEEQLQNNLRRGSVRECTRIGRLAIGHGQEDNEIDCDVFFCFQKVVSLRLLFLNQRSFSVNMYFGQKSGSIPHQSKRSISLAISWIYIYICGATQFSFWVPLSMYLFLRCIFRFRHSVLPEMELFSSWFSPRWNSLAHGTSSPGNVQLLCFGAQSVR